MIRRRRKTASTFLRANCSVSVVKAARPSSLSKELLPGVCQLRTCEIRDSEPGVCVRNSPSPSWLSSLSVGVLIPMAVSQRSRTSSTILASGRRTAKDLDLACPRLVPELETSRERGGVGGVARPDPELDDEFDAGPIGRPLYSGCGARGESSTDVGRAVRASRPSRTLTMAFR